MAVQAGNQETNNISEGKLNITATHLKKYGLNNFGDTPRGDIPISPNSLYYLELSHDFISTQKGILYIVTNEEFRENGLYVLDQVIDYNGEKYLKVNIFNYGKRSILIEQNETICTLFLNEITEDGK